MAEVIVVDEVTLIVDGERILERVSFQVGAEEALALVGPSGSGKTSLLRIISGLQVPTGGRIVLKGRVASGYGRLVPPYERGVGMMFQRPSLWPHMTVAQNVAFGLCNLRREDARARLEQVIRMTSLTGLERRYPNQLSGGEAQRAALARAIAPLPPILLLDEPLSGLDRALHAEMLELLGRVRRETGAVFVYVTHDHGEAEAITDRVVVLRRGEVEFQGSWEEAKRRGHAG